MNQEALWMAQLNNKVKILSAFKIAKVSIQESEEDSNKKVIRVMQTTRMKN